MSLQLLEALLSCRLSMRVSVQEIVSTIFPVCIKEFSLNFCC